MKLFKIVNIGFFLIILGIAGIIYDQYSYTKYEKVIDIGPFEATVATERHCVRLPVIFGALVILSGIGIVFLEKKGIKGK